MTTPVYDRHGIRVHQGDCLAVLRADELGYDYRLGYTPPAIPDSSIHAVVTDPPAAVAFMGRIWDSDRGGRTQWVAWLAERMREAHRVLKPGGYGLVWALPRTSHWTAWALEDAGFEIRDCIIHAFGAGMPKSLDVGRAIDKRGGTDGSWFADWLTEARTAAGISRDEVSSHFPSKTGGKTGKVWNWEHGHGVCTQDEFDRLCDLLDQPRRDVFEAEGEFIAARRGRHGRFGPGDTRGNGPRLPITAPATDAARQWDGWGTALKPSQEMWWLIRKKMPGTVAQTVLEHGTGALNIGACKVAHAGAADLAASQAKNPGRADAVTSDVYGAGRPQQQVNAAGRWPANLVLTHAGRCDDDGCRPEWCPVAELDAQSGTSTSPTKVTTGGKALGVMNDDGWRAQPGKRADCYGDTGGASRFFHTFRWEAKAPASERPMVGGKAHETVKPLALCRFFVKLVCAPGGTVLDCFAGTGTTGQAARAEGMKAVLIEQDGEHIDKIRARLDARPKTTAAQAKPAVDEPMDLLDLLDGSAS